jgi:hypothetical protein
MSNPSRTATPMEAMITPPSGRESDCRSPRCCRHVARQHPAALRAQHLHGQQADQAEAGHNDVFAQSRVDQAKALKTDGGQDGEGRLLVAHTLGDARAKVLRYANDLRVPSVGHHTIAHGEGIHPGSDLGDDAHVAIAHRQRPVQLVLHCFLRSFSRTMRTLSGCCRALSSQLALPNSTSIRLVPAEISEVAV